MIDARSPRTDFREAAEAFMALVALVPGDAWSRPGLGLWTVRELVGHTARALGTVEEYLVVPPSGPAVADAVAYFRAGTAAGITNSEAVAERGRLAGRELGPRPVEAVAGLSERVLGLVEQTPDDATVTSRLGVMRLIDYLPTRTFELAVHGLDLNAAVRTDWTVPRGPLASAVEVATALALEQGLGPHLLMALTGRQPLPEGTCVL